MNYPRYSYSFSCLSLIKGIQAAPTTFKIQMRRTGSVPVFKICKEERYV